MWPERLIRTKDPQTIEQREARVLDAPERGVHLVVPDVRRPQAAVAAPAVASNRVMDQPSQPLRWNRVGDEREMR